MLQCVLMERCLRTSITPLLFECCTFLGKAIYYVPKQAPCPLYLFFPFPKGKKTPNNQKNIKLKKN